MAGRHGPLFASAQATRSHPNRAAAGTESSSSASSSSVRAGGLGFRILGGGAGSGIAAAVAAASAVAVPPGDEPSSYTYYYYSYDELAVAGDRHGGDKDASNRSVRARAQLGCYCNQIDAVALICLRFALGRVVSRAGLGVPVGRCHEEFFLHFFFIFYVI